MKIKVRRYKQIEQLALSEALVKIIKEINVSDTQVAALQSAINALNLEPEAVRQINAIIAAQLGLVSAATGEAE